jgi:hypothetical protein
MSLRANPQRPLKRSNLKNSPPWEGIKGWGDLIKKLFTYTFKKRGTIPRFFSLFFIDFLCFVLYM